MQLCTPLALQHGYQSSGAEDQLLMSERQYATLRPHAGGPSASTEASLPELVQVVKKLEVKMENVERELRSRGSQDMSAASVEAAEQVWSI